MRPKTSREERSEGSAEQTRASFKPQRRRPGGSAEEGVAAQVRAEVEFGETFAGAGTQRHSDEDLAMELLTTQGVSVQPGHFYEFPAEGSLLVSLITSNQSSLRKQNRFSLRSNSARTPR